MVLVREILCKLPIKSLVRCTCISKSCRSIIMNPDFISTHLNGAISSENSRLFLFRLCSITGPYKNRLQENYSLRFEDESLTEYKEFDFPFRTLLNQYFRIAGSCNGLILLADDFPLKGLLFILWNPSIRKFVLLPTPNMALCRNFYDHARFYEHFLGFGFDTRTNDYKVLLFFQFSEPGNGDMVEAELYSLNTNSWRSITDSAPRGVVIQTKQVFVNGAIHWIGSRSFGNLVMVFDVSDEIFSEILLPDCLTPVHYKYLRLRRFGDSSIAIIQEDDVGSHIWVMKVYGEVQSWTKVSVVSLENSSGGLKWSKGYAFRSNEELLLGLVRDSTPMVALNISNTQIRRLFYTKHARIYANLFLDNYMESMVLIDRGESTKIANEYITEQFAWLIFQNQSRYNFLETKKEEIEAKPRNRALQIKRRREKRLEEQLQEQIFNDISSAVRVDFLERVERSNFVSSCALWFWGPPMGFKQRISR